LLSNFKAFLFTDVDDFDMMYPHATVIQSPRPICVPRDYFMVDRFQVTWLGHHYKTSANKKGQRADISSSN
jgi:hypothetical protein